MDHLEYKINGELTKRIVRICIHDQRVPISIIIYKHTRKQKQIDAQLCLDCNRVWGSFTKLQQSENDIRKIMTLLEIKERRVKK